MDETSEEDEASLLAVSRSGLVPSSVSHQSLLQQVYELRFLLLGLPQPCNAFRRVVIVTHGHIELVVVSRSQRLRDASIGSGIAADGWAVELPIVPLERSVTPMTLREFRPLAFH
jgi:hypothetical protein